MLGDADRRGGVVHGEILDRAHGLGEPVGPGADAPVGGQGAGAGLVVEGAAERCLRLRRVQRAGGEGVEPGAEGVVLGGVLDEEGGEGLGRLRPEPRLDVHRRVGLGRVARLAVGGEGDGDDVLAEAGVVVGRAGAVGAEVVAAAAEPHAPGVGSLDPAGDAVALVAEAGDAALGVVFHPALVAALAGELAEEGEVVARAGRGGWHGVSARRRRRSPRGGSRRRGCRRGRGRGGG